MKPYNHNLSLVRYVNNEYFTNKLLSIKTSLITANAIFLESLGRTGDLEAFYADILANMYFPINDRSIPDGRCMCDVESVRKACRL